MSLLALETLSGVYLGNRGVAFKSMIEKLLKKGNLKQKYIDIFTSEKNLKIFSAAFTSEQIDENDNYQVYEQLGDLTLNKFIVWYIYTRFPQLKCAEGVKVAARLRINLGSKDSFSVIAEKLGFWDFISATNDLRQKKKKPLLEDVFEAFIGAAESILDRETATGVGYSCVYKILSGIYNDIEISLRYEDLYDAKTRLKEVFDIHSDKLGPIKYEERREDLLSHVMIYRLDGAKYETKEDGTLNTSKIIGDYRKILIGQGSAALKADAEQNAASVALKTLECQGFIKYAPSIYAKFADNRRDEKQTEINDILQIIGDKEKINDSFFTKGKSKYQSKYTSPVLINYCRKKDYQGIKLCMGLGADPNKTDSDGMTPLDILLLNNSNYHELDILIQLLSTKNILDIHKNVSEFYNDILNKNKYKNKLNIIK